MKISGLHLIRFSLLLILISVVTFIYWILYKRPIAGIDDTDIYFTYAKNFVNGFGFIYYPGGERVEGFTSFLWLMIASLFYWIDQENYPRIMLCFNVVAITFALFLCCNFIKKLTRSPAIISPGEILFLILLTIIPGYIDWTIITLMETGLWSVLLVIITLRICTFRPNVAADPIILSALLVVLVFLRPESLLWSFAFIFLSFLKSFHDLRSAKDSLRITVFPLGLVILSIAAITVFRLQYFGYPLPNTYYAKVSSDVFYNLVQGIKYFLFSAIQTPILILITVASLFSWVYTVFILVRSINHEEQAPEGSWIQFTLASVTILSLAISLYVGGDHFKLLRLYQPVFPVFLLVLFNTSFWQRIISVRLNFKPVYNYLIVLLLVPFLYLSTDTPLHTYYKFSSPIEWEFELSERGREDAEKLNTMFRRLDTLPSVGISAAGGIGYCYNGKVLDLMGLNNLKMAHARKEKSGHKGHAAFDKQTFFELEPDIFHGYYRISTFVTDVRDNTYPANRPNFNTSFVAEIYKNIFTDQQFIETYKPVLIVDPESELVLKTYANRKFLEKLRKNNYSIIENYWEDQRMTEELIVATLKDYN